MPKRKCKFRSSSKMKSYLLLLVLLHQLSSNCCNAFMRPVQKTLKRIVLPTMMNPLSQDVLSSCAALGGSVVWLQIWMTLAKEGKIDPRLSRKIIHCGSAPLFIFVWPLYSSNDLTSRVVAASIPLVQMTRWTL